MSKDSDRLEVDRVQIAMEYRIQACKTDAAEELQCLRQKLAQTECELKQARDIIRAMRPEDAEPSGFSGPSPTVEKSEEITGQFAEFEQSLEVSQRYELLAAHSRDIMLFVRRRDGRILEANAAAIEAYGYSGDELQSMTIYDLRAPETRSLAPAEMTIADRQGILFESVHLRKDGSTFPVEVSSQGATIGGTRALLSVIRDITARKRGEKALRESESRFRRVFENLQEFMMIWEVERDNAGQIFERRLIDANPAFLRGSGFSWPDEIRGKTASEVFGAGWSAARLDVIREAMNSGSPITQEMHHDELDRDFLTTIVPLDANTYIATGRDITEQKRSQEALRQSEERFSKAFYGSPSAMAITRPADQTLVNANDSFLRLFEYSREEAIGRAMVDDLHLYCYPERERASALRIFQAEGSVPTREIQMKTKTGKILTVLFSSEMISFAGEGNVACTTIVDITERKRSEAALIESERIAMQHEQLRALAEKLQTAREEERALVARDLHDDLGQLLTAVKMDLVWIGKRMECRDGEVRHRLDATVKLINDGVKSVRKICTGLRPSILDDLGLAAAIEWQAQEFATRTGICCRVWLPDESPNLTSEIATTFFRIFQESLTNVGRHSHARVVDASLELDGGDLVLRVRDDGRGFSGSPRASSMGILGMKERAQTCGGKLLINSSAGKGTTVTLRVPIGSVCSQQDGSGL